MKTYIDLKRIEFVVTNACTSHCGHCSLGSFLDGPKMAIDKESAVSVVTELAKLYPVQFVMTFGGEPLLYADTVCAIHRAAADCGIPTRQVITNGFFSRDEKKIETVAQELKESGVNSLLLSIDTFHAEHLPFDAVYHFAEALCGQKTEGFRLHPAWVVSREAQNKYNTETTACLARFAGLQIPVNRGNVITPAGNAALNLSEYYEKTAVDLGAPCGEAPYTDRLDDVRCLSVSPNGDVNVCDFAIGNVYHQDIADIIARYDPYSDPYTAALMSGGVRELMKIAKKDGIAIDTAKYYSACGICHEIMQKRGENGAPGGCALQFTSNFV